MKVDYPLSIYVRSFFQDHLVCRRNMAGGTVKSYRDAVKLFLQFASNRCGVPVCDVEVTDIPRSMIMEFLTISNKTAAIQSKHETIVLPYCGISSSTLLPKNLS